MPERGLKLWRYSDITESSATGRNRHRSKRDGIRMGTEKEHNNRIQIQMERIPRSLTGA